MTCRFNITLSLVGPVLSRSSEVGRPGTDAPVQRDAQGHPILRGTQLKGLLLDSWSQLGTVPGLTTDFRNAIQHWLGKSAEDEGGRHAGTGVAPRRGGLVLPDSLRLELAPNQPMPEAARARLPIHHGTRSRIALDETLGAVREQMLQVCEMVFSSGAKVLATGTATAEVMNLHQAEALRSQLEGGLQWVLRAGGMRSVGFGRVTGASVTLEEVRPEPESVPGAPHPTEIDCLELILQPEGPLCFARHRTTQNLFESLDLIPGSALRGALAEKWRSRCGAPREAACVREFRDPRHPHLTRHFDRLVFFNALPTCGLFRPLSPPLSLVHQGTGFTDVATLNPEPLGDSQLLDGDTPAFAVDWKGSEFAKVWSAFGWARPARALSVRTAINPETRKADDQKLFAWETVLPMTSEGDEISWRSRISLAAIPDPAERQAVARELSDLLDGRLGGLGKTKAQARVTLATGRVDPTPSAVSAGPGPTWRVVLQSDALLVDPRFQNGVQAEGHPVPRSGPLNGQEMHALYDAVWRQLSTPLDCPERGPALELVTHFARQRLAGGFYLWQRFQPDAAYNPWLLTEAGSTFVLRAVPGREAEAQSLLDNWLRLGLPLPAWSRDAYRLQGDESGFWTRCPFVPQNGFGEIAVNPPTHAITGEVAHA